MKTRRRFSRARTQFVALTSAFLFGSFVISILPDSRPAGPTYVTAAEPTNPKTGGATKLSLIETGDWPQLGGNSYRNNTPQGSDIATDWATGRFDRRTGEWIKDRAKNIKWVAKLGSNAYGNPVVADGRVFIGSNNGSGYLERFPSDVDLGCLLCFRESDGEFLWQYSIEALEKKYYYPGQGLCSTPLVEGERLWVVTNAGTIACLDTQGFRDGENDGPVQDEEVTAENEADVIWTFNMMKELGSQQHDMCACAITAFGDLLFASTSNGIDEAHEHLPAPDAPSFVCLDKNTGKVYWTDNSPGTNILHGQWGSPAAGVINGIPQVIFTGGDGWVYSFKCNQGKDGKPELLWKFDANPKDTEWIDHGRGSKNNILACPVINDDRVYITVGQDPDHGADQGHLWCIAPTKTGDISEQLVVKTTDKTQVVVPPRRVKALDPEQGEKAIPNPNSCVVWHYDSTDLNGNDEIEFEETMHRSVGTVAVKNKLLFVSDVSGIVHCLDTETGKPHWTYDMLANSWGSPLIVDDKVYFGDEDGDVAIFELSAEPQEPLAEINMGGTMYSTPIVANNVLYISTKSRLFAIQPEE